LTAQTINCNAENNNTAYGNYEFEIDTTPSFNSPEYATTQGNNYNYGYIYKYNSGLLYGTTYYWRARVHNANDTSQWSNTWSFTTMEKLDLHSPANNSINKLTAQTINCNAENNNTAYGNYEFEIDTTPSFNSPEYATTQGDNFNYGYIYKYNSSLLYGTTYYWRARVHNANDTSQWSNTWSFTTMEKLGLHSPANNSSNISITQSLLCNAENNNTAYGNYDFELDTTPNFNSLEYVTTHGVNYNYGYIYKNNSGLLYGTTYYWRARVHNAIDTSQWSNTWSFTTDYEMTNAPVLVFPANNSTSITYNSFSIQWNSIPNAVTYQYQISTTINFSNNVKSGNSSLTNQTITNLQPNTLYYWRVRGENTNGFSPWSNAWSFTTVTTVMTTPTLISPTNNSIGVNYNSVNFSWNSTFGATEYIFEISQDQTFTNGITTQNINAVNNTIVGLNQNTQYFWRVASTDGNTISNWSDVWNFTTDQNINIDIISNQSSVKVYPNPSNDLIVIKSMQRNISKCEIYNTTGKLVISVNIDGLNETINISKLAKGVYYVKITTGENAITKLLIKK
jgi:hypothetical protein